MKINSVSDLHPGLFEKKFFSDKDHCSDSTGLLKKEHKNSHDDHEAVLDQGNRCHRQIEYRSQTGALDLPAPENTAGNTDGSDSDNG